MLNMSDRRTVTLRMPGQLHREIKRLAAAEQRSVNQWCVRALVAATAEQEAAQWSDRLAPRLPLEADRSKRP